MYAEKSWGTYTVIDVQPGSMTVKVSMKVGEHMTYHMHNHREEVWTVVSGEGKAVVDGMEQTLRTGRRHHDSGWLQAYGGGDYGIGYH